jgi:hypothetical protein
LFVLLYPILIALFVLLYPILSTCARGWWGMSCFVQDAKLKTEEDKRAQVAAVRKGKMRAAIKV